jgi:hypothetical protein
MTFPNKRNPSPYIQQPTPPRYTPPPVPPGYGGQPGINLGGGMGRPPIQVLPPNQGQPIYRPMMRQSGGRVAKYDGGGLTGVGTPAFSANVPPMGMGYGQPDNNPQIDPQMLIDLGNALGGGGLDGSGMGMNPLARKKGGRANADVPVKEPGRTPEGYAKMDYGAASGKGRRQKILAQED